MSPSSTGRAPEDTTASLQLEDTCVISSGGKGGKEGGRGG